MTESVVAPAIAAPPIVRWNVVPQGMFSRHFDLLRDGEAVATLRMGFFRERCEFEIGGHRFSIERTSLWKDAFRLAVQDQGVCDATRGFWSRGFQIATDNKRWVLRPVGWLALAYQLVAGEHPVGTIRLAGWFTRRRIADFSTDVPPPIQVLAIFLVLMLAQRSQQSTGN